MTRHDLHHLIDQVPEENLPRVARFLEALLDPVMVAMDTAPFDDEPWTDADESAVQEGLRDVAAGRVTSLESLMKQYGVEVPEL